MTGPVPPQKDPELMNKLMMSMGQMPQDTTLPSPDTQRARSDSLRTAERLIRQAAASGNQELFEEALARYKDVAARYFVGMSQLDSAEAAEGPAMMRAQIPFMGDALETQYGGQLNRTLFGQDMAEAGRNMPFRGR